MCAEPEKVASQIQALVPELDDLDLRRRLPVKGRYHEMLTDMNARHIARLDPHGSRRSTACSDPTANCWRISATRCWTMIHMAELPPWPPMHKGGIRTAGARP